jgi:RNA-dependent RNA polymerase
MNGPRPHPLEMSGGDLDGDTFWICNYKELIFESNEKPFDYQDQTVEAERKAQMESGTKFTIEDVCNFFGEYIKADK